MWSPGPENCQNRNPHTSKISKLLPACLTNNRRRSDQISEPHAKCRENQWRIVDVIVRQPICSQTHRQTDGKTDCLSNALDRPSSKHNCVLSNAGLSNALTKTGICRYLKPDFYFRFHWPLHTKSALLNFICMWDLVLTCWKMWWPEPESCRNPIPYTPKIGKLLPVRLTKKQASMLSHVW